MALSFYNAAVQILKEAHEPLPIAEITKRAVDADLLAKKGKNPAVSMQSLISADLRARGDASVFLSVAEGTYALREWGPAADAVQVNEDADGKA